MRFIQKYDRMNPSSNTKYEIVIEMMLCVAKIPLGKQQRIIRYSHMKDVTGKRRYLRGTFVVILASYCSPSEVIIMVPKRGDNKGRILKIGEWQEPISPYTC